MVKRHLTGPTETLIEDGVIADVAQAVGRPASAPVIDLADQTVTPGFIDASSCACGRNKPSRSERRPAENRG